MNHRFQFSTPEKPIIVPPELLRTPDVVEQFRQARQFGLVMIKRRSHELLGTGRYSGEVGPVIDGNKPGVTPVEILEAAVGVEAKMLEAGVPQPEATMAAGKWLMRMIEYIKRRRHAYVHVSATA